MSAVETWSLAAVLGSAVLLIILERRAPYNPGQPLLRDGFWNDLVLYCFVQSYVLGVLIARLVGYVDAQTGWSRLHLVTHWPPLVQMIFFTITHDLYIYLFHRWQHNSPVLWRLHEAHHSAKYVDWLAGVRSHSLEIFINQTVEFAPLVLLGATPEVIVVKGAVSAIWGMFIHSNIDVRLGRLQYVFNGPEMHRWHHSNANAAHGKNYSTKFAFWDWMFGTAYFPDRDAVRAGDYGVTERRYREDFPVGYFAQHAYPFLPSNAPDAPDAPAAALADAGPTITAVVPRQS